jgi:hypothetical protein
MSPIVAVIYFAADSSGYTGGGTSDNTALRPVGG